MLTIEMKRHDVIVTLKDDYGNLEIVNFNQRGHLHNSCRNCWDIVFSLQMRKILIKTKKLTKETTDGYDQI